VNENDARAALRAIVAALEEALVEKAGPELAKRLGRRVSDTEVRQYLAQKRAPEHQQVERPRPPNHKPQQKLAAAMAALAKHQEDL